jgi:universal stress protein A
MAHDFKTVLCGTDFTEHSYKALDYALRLAQLAQGVLIVAHGVHVLSDLFTGTEHVRTFAEGTRLAREKLAELHRTRLGGYAKTELVVDIGAPAELLIQLARDKNADVVVTATRGRSELVDLLLGSTAEKIIRHAPCPVFVVRDATA